MQPPQRKCPVLGRGRMTSGCDVVLCEDGDTHEQPRGPILGRQNCMKYYKYWATTSVMIMRKGKEFSVSVKGFSSESQIAAINNAESNKTVVSREIVANIYETSRDILVEEVIREIESSPRSTVITRNRYGSLVLNSTDIIFTDHDMDAMQESFLMSLFRRRPKNKQALLDSIRTSLLKRGLYARVYETKNGYRCIITNKSEPGGTRESISLLKKLHCDKQYIHMTKVQECYRARLTPKPFRMKLSKPPIRFPYATEKARELFNEWLLTYQRELVKYATCKFVEEIGSTMDSRILGVVKIHDELTKSSTNLTLA
jgi:hypothetical protein